MKNKLENKDFVFIKNYTPSGAEAVMIFDDREEYIKIIGENEGLLFIDEEGTTYTFAEGITYVYHNTKIPL